jgi:Ca2+-binding EF-hand superfamily protein
MSKWDKLSKEQRDQITQAFEICDSDGSGTIDKDELKQVLLALGEVNFLLFMKRSQQTKWLMSY